MLDEMAASPRRFASPDRLARIMRRLDDSVAAMEVGDPGAAHTALWNLLVEIASLPDERGRTEMRATLAELLGGLYAQARRIGLAVDGDAEDD